jgi:hypothetical protein
METFMNQTFARIACALALSASTGCADFYFSYVEDAKLKVPVEDIGSNCETDDPVDTDIARAHIEQDGDVCVMTADALVLAIEYADLEDAVDEITDLAEGQAEWPAGGICWRQAQSQDIGQAYEKCDFGPKVQAEWRLVGEEVYSPNPEFPDDATAWLEIAYYPGPVTTLDDVGGAPPAITFGTSGQEFPNGTVGLNDSNFFDVFRNAVSQEQDVYSVVHAEVEVPMSVVADFTEHEYEITFAYQMYVQGVVLDQSFWEIFFESLFGGGEE